MKLKDMLDLWVKITDVNPQEQKTHYTISFDGRLSDYDIEKMNKKIQQALEYDQTGLFAEAYLSHYFNRYITERNFSLNEYLQNKDMTEYLRDVSNLYEQLQQSTAEKQIMEEAKKAMTFYSLPFEELSLFDIAEIRTCAENCIEKNLRLLQFRTGEAQSDSFKMSRDILMYKDLNALIVCAAQGDIDGVSMAYIRNETDITLSYFAFVIKNGENLYLLTDQPTFVHPLQSSMTRCPGRNMSRRIETNLFPYDTVANINIDDLWGSGRYGTSEKSESLSTVFSSDTSKILYQKIGTIDSLSQTESFWFVMMLSLIKEKFYAKAAPQLKLSYTGSQIIHPMITENETTLIVRKNMPTLTLDNLSYEDIENLTFDAFYEEHYKSDWYQYLLDRYKDVVEEEIYNITPEADTLLLEDRNQRNQKTYLPFDVMEECGTEEEIRYRQKWIARYNYAQKIQSLLDEEFTKNAAHVKQEVKDMIEANLENLVMETIRGNAIDHSHTGRSFEIIYNGETHSMAKISTFDKYWDNYESTTFFFSQGPADIKRKNDIKSVFTGNTPGIAITLNPKTTKGLTCLCGCEKDELPEQVRHWTKSHYYYGNSILDNIDPVAFTMNDPYNELDFSVTIILSKKEYMQLAEKAGVHVEKFWLSEKPKCFRNTFTEKEKCLGDYKIVQNKETFKYQRTLYKKCENCKFLDKEVVNDL